VPEIKINEKTYQKIKKIADFLNWSIEKTVDELLCSEIDGIESEPLNFLEHYLNNDQMLKLVFGSGD
jgi:hypothetical protein